jgi:hypothetical protein
MCVSDIYHMYIYVAVFRIFWGVACIKDHSEALIDDRREGVMCALCHDYFEMNWSDLESL